MLSIAFHYYTYFNCVLTLKHSNPRSTGLMFLDISYLCAISSNTIMGFQRFAAVIMRIREPKTTALIFASGKMVRANYFLVILRQLLESALSYIYIFY